MSGASSVGVEENNGERQIKGLDLYEYACADGRANYSETIGVLRSRLVKAMPKDQTTSIACLNACIYHSDWLHAQEVTILWHILARSPTNLSDYRVNGEKLSQCQEISNVQYLHN